MKAGEVWECRDNTVRAEVLLEVPDATMVSDRFIIKEIWDTGFIRITTRAPDGKYYAFSETPYDLVKLRGT